MILAKIMRSVSSIVLLEPPGVLKSSDADIATAIGAFETPGTVLSAIAAGGPLLLLLLLSTMSLLLAA